MRTTFKSIFALTAAALTLASCAKELESSIYEAPLGEGRQVKFVAESIETKTVFGEKNLDSNKYPTYWTAADAAIGISVNFKGDSSAEVTPDANSETVSGCFTRAEFDATLADDQSGAYTFYAISPYSALYGHMQNNGTYTNWSVEIPASQTPTATSVDPAAQILVAKSESFSAWPETVSLNFSHLTAYGCISLENLPDLGNATITGVSLTSEVPFAGRNRFNLDAENYGTYALEWSSSIISLAVNHADNIWFACAPAQTQGKTLKVTVAVEGKGTLEKTVTLPGNLTAGKVAKFAVNFTGVTFEDEKVYKLVKSGTIAAGDKVLIVNTDGTYAMSTSTNTNNVAAVAVTAENDEIINPAANVQVIDVVEGNKSGTVALKYGEKYLYASGGTSSNRLQVKADLDDNGSWIATIDADGIATVVAQGASTRNYMRYNPNSGNPIFNCYAATSTTGTLVTIYRLEGPSKIQLDAPADVQAVSDANSITVSWTDITVVSPLAVTYKVTCTGQDDKNVNQGVGSVVFDKLAAGIYDVSITAIPSDLENYSASQTVTKEGIVVGTLALTKPVIASFNQTKSGFNATIEAAVPNATKYSWAVYEDEVDVDNLLGSGETTSLSFSATIDPDTWEIGAWANGNTYVLVVTAEADGYTSASSEPASFVAQDINTSIADVISGGVGTYEVEGVTVMAVKGNALILGDGTGNVYAFKSGHGLSVGDVVTVSGETIMYNNEVYEFNSPTLTKTSTAPGVDHGTAADVDTNASAWQTAFASAHSAVYVHATGTQSSRNITTDGGTVLYLSAAESATDNKTVEVYGYIYAYSSSHSNFNFLVTSIQEYVDPNAPAISVDPASYDWPSNNAETKVFTVTATNGTWDYDDSAVTSWASVGRSGSTLQIAPRAAQASAANSGTITITLTPTDPSYSQKTATITLTQAKYSYSGAPDPEQIVFANLNLENSKQYSDPFDGGHFTITFGGGGNDGKYYTTGSGIRTYGGGTITIASTNYNIATIEFTWDGSYAPTADVANPTGYSTSTNKWTGSAKTIVLTRPSGSGHWRLKSVKVTYAD